MFIISCAALLVFGVAFKVIDEAFDARSEKVELENDPEDEQVDEPTGQGEQHPGGEVERMTWILTVHEGHQDQVWRSSNDGSCSSNVGRIANTEFKKILKSSIIYTLKHQP